MASNVTVDRSLAAPTGAACRVGQDTPDNTIKLLTFPRLVASLIKLKVCPMTTSNLSCSQQCDDCKSFPDPTENRNSISRLGDTLNGLQLDDQQGILSWLLEFKELEIQLLKYSSFVEKRAKTS